MSSFFVGVLCISICVANNAQCLSLTRTNLIEQTESNDAVACDAEGYICDCSDLSQVYYCMNTDSGWERLLVKTCNIGTQCLESVRGCANAINPTCAEITTTPQTETPETVTPETETPETETPDTETPKTETPETETPETKTPETETPETETPETETPETETPETETPETETPETETPETETPKTETPETETPETETPETETPKTETPETETPETETPETEPPETEATPTETTPTEEPSPTTPVSICQGDRFYPDENCLYYFDCLTGLAKRRKCPPGQSFSKKYKTCVKSFSDCRATTGTITSTTTTARAPVPERCGDGATLVKDTENCLKYYDCRTVPPTRRQCPVGQSFSSSARQCVVGYYEC